MNKYEKELESIKEEELLIVNKVNIGDCVYFPSHVGPKTCGYVCERTPKEVYVLYVDDVSQRLCAHKSEYPFVGFKKIEDEDTIKNILDCIEFMRYMHVEYDYPEGSDQYKKQRSDRVSEFTIDKKKYKDSY
jgi:hypothetical protein